MRILDLASLDLRSVNGVLQGRADAGGETEFEIHHPKGAHALACGLTQAIDVKIKGHAGYYCAGMNERARVVVDGNVGTGVAENMMSGEVRVRGDAGQSAGATGHGGLLVIDGDASARCGISMKGIDIVVRGSVGHMSAFMAQAGRLVVCGDAGPDLGDSLYEAEIYVAGKVDRLGADCEEKEMRPEDRAALSALLSSAGIDCDVSGFRRYGSARQLYHFNVDNAAAY